MLLRTLGKHEGNNNSYLNKMVCYFIANRTLNHLMHARLKISNFNSFRVKTGLDDTISVSRGSNIIIVESEHHSSSKKNGSLCMDP